MATLLPWIVVYMSVHACQAAFKSAHRVVTVAEEAPAALVCQATMKDG